MKKIFITTVFLFLGIVSYAQLGNAEVIQKIKARYSGGKIPAIKLGKSSTTKEFKGGKWHYYYWRHYTVTAKAKNNKTALKQGGAVVYEKVGNRYIFSSYATGETNLTGMKDPDKTKVLKYLNTHLKDFFISTYGDIVLEKPQISIVPDTKYKWKAADGCVSFTTKAIYKRKVSYTEVETAEHFFKTCLFRDPLPDDNAAWNRVLADEIEAKKKIISKKSYSSSEMDAMKSLQEIDEENQASSAIKNLPYVEDPPVFKSDKQLFYFIHDRLMASAPAEAKAHLYKVLAKSSFQSGSILKNYVQDWVDKLINNLKSYQYTFCKYPKVKDEQSGMIYFYNKDNSRFVRMTAKAEKGTWKIKVIEYFPASQAEINRLWKQVGDCTDKPDLAVKQKINYKIGDIVDVTFSNGTFAGEVKKQDTSFKNRYYVTLLNGGRGYWVKDDVMQPSKQKKSSLQVNDHVNVKTGSGTYKGTVLEIKEGKALIKWDEAGYKNLWTLLTNLTKI